jgi:hypothetical protein
VLAFLGAARVHLHNFTLFLAILLAAAVVTVFVLAATARGETDSNS